MGENFVDTEAGLDSETGLTNRRTAKIEAALRKVEDGNVANDAAAVGSLEAFIHQVNAQRGKKISEADADDLVAGAEELISVLNEP